VGVRVVPAESSNPGRTKRVMEEAVALLRELDAGFPSVKPESVALEVREGFSAAGYAVATAESLDAVALAGANHMHLETNLHGKGTGRASR